MLGVNPKSVLRDDLAQEVIEAAEAGDVSRLEKLMRVLRRHYGEQPEHEAMARKRPEWAWTKPGCAALSLLMAGRGRPFRVFDDL
ncbi:MAG TPA: hypothetical protein VF590_04875, partial [Isosphaeraceae bacterium]